MLESFNWRVVGWTVSALFLILALLGLLALPIEWSLFLKRTSWGGVALSLTVLAVGQGIRGLMGWSASMRFGRAIGLEESYSCWHLSQMAKYVPGGVWLVPARAVLYSDLGFPPAVAASLVLWEVAVILVVGIVIGVLGSWLSLIGGVALLVAAATSVAAIGLISSRRFWAMLDRRGVSGAGLIARGLNGTPGSRLKLLAAPFAVAAASWLLIGSGFYLLLQALGLASNMTLFEGTAVFITAWVAGFVVFVAPGGLGAREATLALALAPVLGAPVAVAVSLAARVWWVAVEALHVVIATFLQRLRGMQPEGARSLK